MQLEDSIARLYNQKIKIMLLRFGVSNYRSIKDYQEISLVAASIKDLGADFIDCPNFKINILPAVAIYGANAAGKSNFLRALRFMCNLVESSHQRAKPDSKINRSYFKLDPLYATEPTQMDCDFILNGDRYSYGLILNDEHILEEWLYSFSGSSKRKVKKTLFHRKVSESSPYYFGPELKGLNRTVTELTRDNSLFLSAAAANNHKQLSEIYKFFASNFLFKSADNLVSPKELSQHLGETDTRVKILDFLQYADTGIVDVETIKSNEPDEKTKLFRQGLNELISTMSDGNAPSILDEEFQIELLIKHRGDSDNNTSMSLSDESAGTIALLGLLGPLFDALKAGGILVLDELNTNLHPLVSRNLITIFNSKNTNPNGAQLLFTTHDTNLLCGGILRRDQIWFAEKDRAGASHF